MVYRYFASSLLLAAFAGLVAASPNQLAIEGSQAVRDQDPGFAGSQRQFKGRMIARPLQPGTAAQRGLVGPAAAQLRRQALQHVSGLKLHHYHDTDELILRVPRGMSPEQFASQLMSTGAYEYVQPDWYLLPARMPNDPQVGSQWHLNRIGAPSAWMHAVGGGMIISVVDTGIRRDHEDLADALLPGFNSVDRRAQVDGGLVDDIHGHGTHVAGCAAAIGNNGRGVSGVGWNFRILPVRASNSSNGGAFTSDILAGARWAADNGARVISASYAGVDWAGDTTGAYCKSKGALFLYAAGNDARNLTFNYQHTIVVGATDSEDRRASFSAFGPGVHVFAPGVGILSTTRNGGYGHMSGTSMATPIANGAYALVWSVNPQLTPDDVQRIMAETADKIGDPSIFGNGRINASAGVARALSTLCTKSLLTSHSLLRGQLSAGGPGSLLEVDAATMDVSSTLLQRSTHSVATEFLYSPAAHQSLANGFRVRVVGNTNVTVRPTFTLSLYNHRTLRWDFIGGTNLLSGQNSSLSFEFSQASGADYRDASGRVRVLVQAFTVSSRVRITPPTPFVLRLDNVEVDNLR